VVFLCRFAGHIPSLYFHALAALYFFLIHFLLFYPLVGFFLSHRPPSFPFLGPWPDLSLSANCPPLRSALSFCTASPRRQRDPNNFLETPALLSSGSERWRIVFFSVFPFLYSPRPLSPQLHPNVIGQRTGFFLFVKRLLPLLRPYIPFPSSPKRPSFPCFSTLSSAFLFSLSPPFTYAVRLSRPSPHPLHRSMLQSRYFPTFLLGHFSLPFCFPTHFQYFFPAYLYTSFAHFFLLGGSIPNRPVGEGSPNPTVFETPFLGFWLLTPGRFERQLHINPYLPL